MNSKELQNQWVSSYLSGDSMTYVENLYEDYLQDPNSVAPDWRIVFDNIVKTEVAHGTSHRNIQQSLIQQANQKTIFMAPADNKQYQVAQLINEYRSHGHHAAKLDPLDLTPLVQIEGLSLSYHKLSESDLDQQFFAGKYFNNSQMPLRDILKLLHETYCGSIGFEYMHISNPIEIEWLQQKIESTRGKPILDSDKKRQILSELIAADGLERYLGIRYVGQKRFSLEGSDALIPLMKELIRLSGKQQVKDLMIGMAHRGRLNVLVNVLGKEPNELFQEFEGKIKFERSGDVKYHIGFSANLRTDSDIVHVSLAFNPSHLEIIGPVVEGSARSRLTLRHNLEQKNQVIPILIHGDAAFTAQGVVMETFNFSQSRWYSTGGTIHIIINNQIGFTTSNPLDARSTLYCTDIAKMVYAPVIHINGDDPEATIFAIQLAFEYRMKFKRDVVIDLVSYRRHGHNEGDEPSVTQPKMYQTIKSKPPLCKIYAESLLKQGLITKEEVKQHNEDYRARLDQGQAVVDVVQADYPGKIFIDWSPYLKTKWTDKANTAISMTTIRELSKKLHSLPSNFELHPVVKRMFLGMEKMTTEEVAMNWGYAETMAYASLLHDGYSVRLAGQDSGRGTFAHRHAILYDVNTGERFIPLEKIITNVNASVAIIDTPLSEEAVLAFEYGYACSEPNALVLWEAQYGDFANGAQVVIDQFISSGEQKWGYLCGLVMLLPHGYEGQGPEHTSARLERYLQLCAQNNIQVCIPTTPAQIFHVLRRQMLRNFRKPLIIMTPKSLLRHKLAVSSLQELTNGQFYTVLPELEPVDITRISKLILCCGKVFYDLLQRRRDAGLHNIAIIRIEQLYPFPKQTLIDEIKKYSSAKTIVWCQEEPQNQGAWFALLPNIEECLSEDQSLSYVGREFAAAPAVGSPILHAQQQQELVEMALFK